MTGEQPKDFSIACASHKIIYTRGPQILNKRTFFWNFDLRFFFSESEYLIFFIRLKNLIIIEMINLDKAQAQQTTVIIISMGPHSVRLPTVPSILSLITLSKCKKTIHSLFDSHSSIVNHLDRGMIWYKANNSSSISHKVSHGNATWKLRIIFRHLNLH